VKITIKTVEIIKISTQTNSNKILLMPEHETPYLKM